MNGLVIIITTTFFVVMVVVVGYVLSVNGQSASSNDNDNNYHHHQIMMIISFVVVMNDHSSSLTCLSIGNMQNVLHPLSQTGRSLEYYVLCVYVYTPQHIQTQWVREKQNTCPENPKNKKYGQENDWRIAVGGEKKKQNFQHQRYHQVRVYVYSGQISHSFI